MFMYYKGMLPKAFRDFYQLNEMIHQYQTRQTSLFHVPLSKSKHKSTSIRCMGVKLWNEKYVKLQIDKYIGISNFKHYVRELLLTGEIQYTVVFTCVSYVYHKNVKPLDS